MSKRASIIYLCLAPVLFLLSWFISHKLYVQYMAHNTGDMHQNSDERSITYAAFFTGLYLAVFLVLRDLYKPSTKA
jgi:TRAP-type C4-dicarboxylate transport system permease small subunit